MHLYPQSDLIFLFKFLANLESASKKPLMRVTGD
jgi:hypothetical protein